MTMAVARCTCPKDSQGQKCGLNWTCAIHGPSGKDPIKPWLLGEIDKRFLRSMRIATIDAADVEAVREADERGPFNPPRTGA